MAIGVLSGNAGICHLNVNVAMYEEMSALYPRPVNVPTSTTVLTATTAALEVVTSQTVTAGGLITYSTKNNGTNAALQAAKTIQLQTCNNSFYLNDNANGSAYDYVSAAAMWSFAFTWVFALWYLSKNLGQIMSAVRRW